MERPSDAYLEAILSDTRADLWAPVVRVLVAEIRRLRSVLNRAYSEAVVVPGTEAVEAELHHEITLIRQESRRRPAV